MSTQGETTVVRTLSGSLWERPARISEELRVGQLEGGTERSFGAIAEAAVASDGTIFLFDSQVPQIYRFSESGDFLGTVGREGEGPGEYSDRPNGMVVDGARLLLADPENARLSAFSLEGAYLGSLGSVTGLRSLFSRELATGGDGALFLRILTIEAGPGELPDPWPIGLEVRGADGAVHDTIQPQMMLGEHARRVEATLWGDVLVGSGSRFVFELRRKDRGVTRVEMPFERAQYSDGELRMLGRALAPAAAADGQAEASLPEMKDPYVEYLFSPDERVWARRPIADSREEASWRLPVHQPSVLDVFDREGRYLGIVPLPPGSRPVVSTGTHLYVIELGEFEEPYLVRYRIDVP